MKSALDAYLCLMGYTDPVAVCPTEKIPCEELSDSERLCRHPLVSVVVPTFNHRRWIEEALEGVLAQRTDFEYEVLVGDDASTDGTGEVCRECQRRHPDRVRFLTSDSNLYRIGGNSRRMRARVRGQFMAFCEGDDYWTDPCKLQKQIDLIRKTGSVACVAFNHIQRPDGRRIPCVRVWGGFADLMDQRVHYYHTSTQVIHRDVFSAYPDIHNWYDSVMTSCAAGFGRVCILPEAVSCYRQTGAGVWTRADGLARSLISLHPFLLLHYFGPDAAGNRAFCAHVCLERIMSGVKCRDAESVAFLAAHGGELLELYRLLTAEQPLLDRLRWTDLWGGSRKVRARIKAACNAKREG